MIEYEFYFRDEREGCKFVGRLQEKRKYPNRITYKSLINWGRKLIGANANIKNLFFIQVRRDDNTVKERQFH